ncbi:MAG: hypothetical protein JWO58_1476, partial [Chitinophagaceae bacterium]|nr:hypothetical protein [Chitinophagaceae bacterium]
SLVFFSLAQTGATNFSADQWYAGFRGDAPNQKQLQVVGVKNATGHPTLDAFTPANSIADNNWHNVIIVSDNSGNDVEIYIDGSLKTMTIGTCCGGNTHDFFFNDAANVDNAKIGVILRDAFLDYSQFTMDDFCIWNRALSITEIQNITTDPSTRPSSGLVVDYTFDKFEDLGIGNAGINDIKDQAGSNHADAVNGAQLVMH